MSECQLTNEELIKKVRMWVDELCRTGGKGWTLQVPVNMERDPDILINELCCRFEAMQPKEATTSLVCKHYSDVRVPIIEGVYLAECVACGAKQRRDTLEWELPKATPAEEGPWAEGFAERCGEPSQACDHSKLVGKTLFSPPDMKGEPCIVCLLCGAVRLKNGDWSAPTIDPVPAGESELRDAQPRGYKQKCDWPGCFQDSLCTSGNVGGAFVCKEHFKITNGRASEDLTVDDLRCLMYMAGRVAKREAEETTQTVPPNCLLEANAVINGERQDMYGAPEDSFEIIAGYWNVFLREKIKQACSKRGMDKLDIPDLLTPLDATNMLVLFKQARKLGQKPCRDNYVDACGYEGIGADRLLKEQIPTTVIFDNTKERFQATLKKAATALEGL